MIFLATLVGGGTVRTTAEILLAWWPDWHFKQLFDLLHPEALVGRPTRRSKRVP